MFLHKLKSRLAQIREPEYARILALRTVGNFLVLFSLFVIIKTFYLPLREEVRYFADQAAGKSYVVLTKNEVEQIEKKGPGFSQLLSQNRVAPLIPKDTDFSIVIPKIAANASVMADVNPASEQEYLTALEKGVAHAKGTALPGQGDNVYLFSHSTDYFYNVTRYNAVFYLLYKLESGDEVDIFYKGERFRYVVYDQKIVDPSDVHYLTERTGHEQLTLQTCWPLGTTLQRLLVFARPAGEISSLK